MQHAFHPPPSPVSFYLSFLHFRSQAVAKIFALHLSLGIRPIPPIPLVRLDKNTFLSLPFPPFFSPREGRNSRKRLSKSTAPATAETVAAGVARPCQDDERWRAIAPSEDPRRPWWRFPSTLSARAWNYRRRGMETRRERTRRGGYGMAKVKRRTNCVCVCVCVYIWIEPDGKWMEGGGINYCHSRIPMVCLVANTAIRHRTRPTSYPTSSWPCSTPTVPVGRNATTTASIHLPPPPPPAHWGVYIYPAYHGPVICHWITLIKRFSPSVGCRARSFIDASAIPWISLRSTREGGVEWGGGNRRLRSVLTRPIGNSLLDGRYVAQDCVTIGAGNNRPWRSAERGEGREEGVRGMIQD